MCGLVAVLSKSKFGVLSSETTLFETMLYTDAIRGWDSSGTFGVNKFGNLDWFKSRGTPQMLFSNKEYADYMKNFHTTGVALVGHNRKATVGAISDDTAHPFTEGTITAVHNGNISNHDFLQPKLEVDSMCIPHVLNRENYHTALDKFSGAFALIWYNAETRKIHFCRNSQRPLAFVETHSAYVVASEMDMLKWLVGRSQYKIVKETNVLAGDVWTYDVDTCTLTVENQVFNKPFTKTTNTHVGGLVASGKQISTINHTKKETAKEVGLSVVPKSSTKIIFELYDFKECPDQNGYDAIGYGIGINPPHQEIRFFFDMEDLISHESEELFIGDWSHTSHHNVDGSTVWLLPNSVTAYTAPENKAITSYNQEIITKQVWCTMPKKCFTCNKKIQKSDIEECITDVSTTRRNKHKVWCPSCSKKMASTSYVH